MRQAVWSVCIYTLSWLVEYVSVLWNCHAVNADGKTAYERLRGKKSRMFGLGFGEKVHWRHVVVTGHRTNKLDSVCFEGIYLGHTTLSDESIVGNRDGVFKTRTICRVPLEERWHFNLLQSLGGVAWKCNPQADESEQVVQDGIPPSPSASPTVPSLLFPSSRKRLHARSTSRPRSLSKSAIPLGARTAVRCRKDVPGWCTAIIVASVRWRP